MADSTLPSNEHLLDEHGRPYHPDMELSWQTYLGNNGQQQPAEVRRAYIAAWYAAHAYAAGWPDRQSSETGACQHDVSKPGCTVIPNGLCAFKCVECQQSWDVDGLERRLTPSEEASFNKSRPPAQKAKVVLPTCAHGATSEEVCPECMGLPSDNPDEEIS